MFPQNLDVTVALYNQVRETILDVEYPLVQNQLAEIDTQLERAISQLNWTNEGMGVYPLRVVGLHLRMLLLQECGSILRRRGTRCVIWSGGSGWPRATWRAW